MQPNGSRFTGVDSGNMPARRATHSDLDLRHSGYLPDAVREEENELLQKGYVISRTLDVERQLARKINDTKRRIHFDAVETYAGLVDDTVDLKDAIQNEEKQELVIGFAQVVLNDGATSFMRSLKIAEGKVNRVGEQDLSIGLNARKPKDNINKRRRLTWGERFRGVIDE